MTKTQSQVNSIDRSYLEQAVSLARQARDRTDHPFGSVIVTAEGRVVEGLNTVVTMSDPTGHAETNVVRLAGKILSAEELASSTLYTSTEPCIMCAGAIYWSGIKRVVFALSEATLAEIVSTQEGVPTLRFPCREVFDRADDVVDVLGPIDIEGCESVHIGYW